MQPDLFQTRPRFDGATIDLDLDTPRLTGQLERVKALMSDGNWRCLGDIAAAVHGSEAGVSARLRDLRKQQFGAYRVERKRVTGGLWLYRLEV